MNNISVLLAEDHSIVRKALISLLKEEKSIEAHYEAENGREAVQKTDNLQPDVAIIDISMPVLNGVEATRRITKRTPETSVLILTRHANEEYVFEALKAGASGYLVKKDLPKELISALNTVSNGEKYFSPSATTKIVDKFLENGIEGDEVFKQCSLTSREREVLQLIAEGNKNREIAKILGLSKKTVESHRTNLMQKLDLHNVADLTRYAIEKGIIELESE